MEHRAGVALPRIDPQPDDPRPGCMTPEEWQHVKQILDDAMEIVPGERAAFVEQACRGDAALRAEVESLLLSFDNVGAFMARPAAAPAGLVEPESLAPGASLGRYRIVQSIAEGGMGAV